MERELRESGESHRHRRERPQQRSPRTVVAHYGGDDEIVEVINHGRSRRSPEDFGCRTFEARRRGMMDEEDRRTREAARMLREAAERELDRSERDRRRRRGERDVWR